MKKYIFLDENRETHQYFGKGEVNFDIDDNTEVEFEYCPATALLYIRRKSYYSEKLSRFNDADAFKQRLTLPSVPRTSNANNSRQSSPQTAQTAANGDERKATSQTPPSTDNAIDFDCDDCDEVFEFDENGNVKEHSRSKAGLRRTYLALRKKVESTANPDASIFMTTTLDSYPTFEKMSKVVADYALQIRRKYSNFKAGFIFLEPCEDGSWHAHWIICFTDLGKLPDFEEDTKKWWTKRNKKPSKYQVVIRQFEDLEDFEHTLDYLNPLSDKQDEDDDGETTKRERIHFYPLNSKPMRCFGDVAESVKGLTTRAVVDATANLEEFEAERRRIRTETYTLDTGEQIGFTEEFVFLVKSFDKKTVDKPPTKEDYFTCRSGDCSSCKHNRDECNHYGQCDYCFAFDTSFCRGCVRNKEGEW